MRRIDKHPHRRNPHSLTVPVSRKNKLALREFAALDIIGSTREEVAGHFIKCGIEDRTVSKDGKVILRVPVYERSTDYLKAIAAFGYIGSTPEEVAFWFIREGIHRAIVDGTISKFSKTRRLSRQIVNNRKKGD